MKVDRKKIWYVFLIAVLIVSVSINLNVSLNEEIVFGDEGYYARFGEQIAEDMKIPLYDEAYGGNPVYKIPLKKTPFTFFLLSSVYLLGGELLMKALIPLVSIISALFLFLLARKLHSTEAGVLATVFYLVMPALITHTIILGAEHIALMFLVASMYFLYRFLEGEKKVHLFISSVLLGFSMLTEASILIMGLVYAVVLFYYKTNWKNWVLEVLTVGLVALVIISPWMFLHNWYQLGNPGFKTGAVFNNLGLDVDFQDRVFTKELPEVETPGLKGPQEIGGGTAASLAEYGPINYAGFAYTLVAFVFSLLGFSFYLIKRKKKYAIPVAWALVFFGGALFMLTGSRVEDLSRNTLPVIAPLAMGAGFFASKIYGYLKSYESLGRMLAVIFLVIFLGWAFFSAQTKAESLRSVKSFSGSFFQGCDWIRENTAEDSLLFSLWGHRVKYQCKRASVAPGSPYFEDAVLTNDNYTYEVFKEYGVDYLYVQKFSIKQGRERVSYPLKFIRYIEKDPHYRQIYSYPQNCMYTKQKDCVVVYEFLTDEELGQNETQSVELPRGLTGNQGV